MNFWPYDRVLTTLHNVRTVSSLPFKGCHELRQSLGHSLAHILHLSWHGDFAGLFFFLALALFLLPPLIGGDRWMEKVVSPQAKGLY